jgi:Leucine-rich repeat (LRR) protein
MRFRLLWLILMLCLLPVSIQAQETLTPYEIALNLIEDARRYEATDLYLNSLDLSALPPEIGQLHLLQRLHLTRDNLQSLPPEIGQLAHLELLEVSSNELSSLPPEIGQLVNLKTLLALNNRLSSLPPEIGQLTQLEVLWLSANQLGSLPSEIGQLTQLRELNLGANQLSSLPPEIGDLAALCHLDINTNQLQHLPSELGHILTPTESCPKPALFLDNNPFISPPPDIIAQNTQVIRAYLREQVGYHTRQLLISVSASLGCLALIMLGLRWRYRHLRKPKVKRAPVV